MNKQQYEDYQRAFSSFLEREGIEGFACHEECEGICTFSSCDCCGRSMSGEGHEVTGYVAGKGPGEEYEVCEDCVYYSAYGHLDDDTMRSIEG